MSIDFRSVKGFLFDVDGTLIDSNDAHALAWCDALKTEGIKVAFDEIRRRIGMGGDHLLPSALGIEKETPLGKRIDKKRGEIFRGLYLPELCAFPKARSVLEEIKRQGFTLVLASSASKKDLAALLKQADLEGIVDEQTSSSDAESSKPEPDIIDAALKRASLKPHEALMVGDTPYDIEAASKAGVKTLAFTCGGWSPEALKGAALIMEGCHELLKAVHPAARNSEKHSLMTR